MTTNAQRARIATAGDYYIGGGQLVGAVSILLFVALLFTGGPAGRMLVGVIPALMLISVGYLKRIATALTPPPPDVD